MTHTIKVDDICDHTHVLRSMTLEEAHGRIGPAWPVTVDGIRGVFASHGDGTIAFIRDKSID